MALVATLLVLSCAPGEWAAVTVNGRAVRLASRGRALAEAGVVPRWGRWWRRSAGGGWVEGRRSRRRWG